MEQKVADMNNFADRVASLFGESTKRAHHSWDAVEAAIGTRLPADYKELIDRTGPVIIDKWLCLYGPSDADSSSSIVGSVADREDAWAEFREAGIELPERFFASGGRLLAFAAIESNYFYWHARPGVAADDWGVVFVDADLDGWHEFDISATECIYRVLTRDIQLYQFDDLFEGPQHKADAFTS
jgi:hypothetical protein